jgi:hypothetical protein
MAVIGFSLQRILIERKEDIKGKVEIKSRINITDIAEEKVELLPDKNVLKFNFEYNITYEPNLATLDFKGHTLITEEPQKAKEILKDWKKKKKIADELRLRVYNVIFQKCNLKALELEEDFNLPPHLPLPRIQSQTAAGYTG